MVRFKNNFECIEKIQLGRNWAIPMGEYSKSVLYLLHFGSVGSSFLRSGSDALHQLKISFEAFYHPEEHRADMLVTFGALCEGPPGHVHGGAISAIADTCMGICAWYSGIACVTANLNVNYKSKIPLLNSCILTSRIGKVEGRKITLEYEMKSTEGVLHSNGCALFIQLKDSERIDPNKVIEEWHNPKSPMVTDW